jgi:hypothetical protein
VLKIEAGEFTDLVRRFEKASKNFPRDAKRLMVTSQRGARTELTKAATEVYNIGRNRLSGSWHVGPVNVANLSYVLTGRAKPFSLLAFQARQTGKGVVAAVMRGGIRQLFKDSFIASAPGTKQIGNPPKPEKRLPWYRPIGKVSRVARAGRYKGRKRYPIKPLFGPSPAKMLLNPKVLIPFGERFAARTVKELVRAIDKAIANG